MPIAKVSVGLFKVELDTLFLQRLFGFLGSPGNNTIERRHKVNSIHKT
jgi:hypothetical protein